MRKSWTEPKAWWKTLATAALAVWAGAWVQGAGAAEVKNVTAKYAWPWGVYINYEVVGTLEAKAPLCVTATDRTKNVSYSSISSALSGDTGTAAGKHQIVWDLDKQGVSIQSTNVVFMVEYNPLYCVVVLSAGANASSYPVTGLSVPPVGGFNTDEYKTTKLVLRKIAAGTFTMGSPTNESYHSGYEYQHKVTLTKPYYIGLFEVTQKQYALVTGSNPSNFSGDKRPVETVSWNTIRGNTDWPASAAVSAGSFMGRLRARTGLEFDLPTEAQWEYACRAGTTTAYGYGDSANGDYMWYQSNSSSQTHEVGTKKPNAWGLYDMHGNVHEWCLDWLKNYLDDETDPKGPAAGHGNGDFRMTRGGNWSSHHAYCRSADRYYSCWPTNMSKCVGFRLSRTVSE